MHIDHFFDPESSTLSYLLADRDSGECAVIDSVLDYDAKSGRTSTASADRLIARVRELGLSTRWILETHAHADHLSAAPHLQRELGGQTAIGAHITETQRVFGRLFNAGADFKPDGAQFNHLLADGEVLPLGRLRLTALHTPGHTPACMTYLVEAPEPTVTGGPALAAFVGDTLFMPDYGTARCDFPGGDARTLYRSIHRVLALPDHCLLHMCHDYRPGGRELRFTCTVAEARADNIHVRDGISEDAFVDMRHARDRTLGVPALLLPSVQVNMRAGELPPPEDNGVRYLKIPLNAI